ncbi:MAG: hypothetical protein AAF495_05800 [Pseudomonadota bacterium]
MKQKTEKQQPEATEAKERRCLMCSEPFMSEWAGDRVCRRCRQTSTWRRG